VVVLFSTQVAGQWLANETLYQKVFPMSLRPQAHEIIRTWAFYTIVKSLHHFNTLPWKELAISGWGLLPKGQGKISKSRGGAGDTDGDDRKVLGGCRTLLGLGIGLWEGYFNYRR